MRWAMRWLPGVLLLGLAFSATAHKPSDAFLTLDRTGETTVLRADLALRDLERAVGLDADGDRAVTWGEVTAAEAAIVAYTRSRLTPRSANGDCRLADAATAIARHSDGPYLALAFTVRCPGGAAVAGMDYGLFFDTDPLHRGLLSVQAKTGSGALVFGPDDRRRDLPQAPGLWTTVTDYLVAGVWHIWIGYDHLLFLLVLLLPAALAGDAGARGVFTSVVRVVTAFTMAHSITLSLAALGYVSLPAAPVEAAIAASIVLAAVLNLRRGWQRHGWLLAFGLGLVHGFGFAGVLANLGLPSAARAAALAGFNLGVEIGQIAVVLAALPVLLALRRFAWPRRLALSGGSLAAAGVAGFWVVERLA